MCAGITHESRACFGKNVRFAHATTCPLRRDACVAGHVATKGCVGNIHAETSNKMIAMVVFSIPLPVHVQEMIHC